MANKEIEAAKIDDLKSGEMKKIEKDGEEFVLYRVEDKFFATGATCPHYGAPLDQGVLKGYRVICPWHHATFCVSDGSLIEPPALDEIPSYETRVDGDTVIVSIPPKSDKPEKPDMTEQKPSKDDRVFVIVGAGAAGTMAAQTLREEGFLGRIILITREDRIPYDRPNLSKEYMAGKAEPEWMPLRDDEFFKENDIELQKNREVVEVDFKEKNIKFNDSTGLTFDRLLLATGGAPKRLDIPGAELDNVFTLRSYDDADRIIEASKKAKKAVVIGASFIGTEIASSLAERDVDVTIVAPEAQPLEKILGEKVGGVFRKAHEEAGTSFKLETRPSAIKGDGAVEKVVLENGDELDADFVVVGVGVAPATAFIDGLEKYGDGSLPVDHAFKVTENVYAAGDIARFTDWRTNEIIRIEHWRTALQHGRYAALNMLEKDVPFRSVPFFWTQQAGLNLGYVGHADEWDEIVIHGDLDAKEFLALYIKADTVLAVAGMGRDRQLDAAEELMRTERMPSAAKLKEGEPDFTAILEA